jgi:hypothetical protein
MKKKSPTQITADGILSILQTIVMDVQNGRCGVPTIDALDVCEEQ